MKNILILASMACILSCCESSNSGKEAYQLFNPDFYDDFSACLEQGDENAKEVLDLLRSEADKILTERKPSVIYKTQLPVSGDVHDYFSMGPYWWPDSSKADGLPWIRRDGLVNPLTRGDNVDTPEKNKMLDFSTKLAAAFYLTGEEKYAEGCTEVLRTWFIKEETRMNPNLQHAQAIPGRTDGRDIGIIDFSHFKDILIAIEIIRTSKAWTDTDESAMNEWLNLYLKWILTSENGKGELKKFNNHGTWVHSHASSIAIHLGRKVTADSLIREMFKRLPDHVMEDGSQPQELRRTRAISYSCYNLEGWLTLAENARLLEMDLSSLEPEGNSLKSAVDFLVENAFETDWSYQEVTGLEGARERLRKLIAYAASQYDDPEYQEIRRSAGYDCTYGLLWYGIID